MLIVPAIDLMNGAVVRLIMGNYSSAVVYGKDPAETAKRFVDAGARRIHVVDLDAARGGEGNRKEIRRVRKAVSCEIEVGGGIRSGNDVEELLDIGIDYLILGTVLARAPRTVQSWVNSFGRRFFAGIDARGGAVKISGWETDTAITDTDLATRCTSMGFSAIIRTAIESDGTLNGPDIDGTSLVAERSELPTFISGGVGSMEDLERVDAAIRDGKRIAGTIIGKAIYEKTLDLKTAIERFGG
jgi:phosphoribosylformimino-5-aminoimidazole carboxamide ribotide isomerase